MHAISNRRVHLVVALALVAFGVARLATEASGVAGLSPTALRVCTAAALFLAAAVVARASRMQHGFVPVIMMLSSLAGTLVGFMTEQMIYVDRPRASLSFAGVDLDGFGGAALGFLVGLALGAIFAAFGIAARALHRRSPEVASIAGWALAASASLAARSFVALVPCALGAAIQIARIRRPRSIAIAERPYR